MSRLSFRIRPVVAVVLLLLIGETMAVYLLSQNNWFVLGDRHRVVTLLILLALPVVALIGFLVRGAFRFSIWQLLLALAILSLLFGRMAQPILEFRSARMGSMSMIQAGCNLTAPGNETKHINDQSGVWTSVFLHEWEKIPVDSKVTCIVLHNDEQVQLLVDHADRFPALRSITFYQVSTESLQQLSEVMHKFDNLIDVWSQNVVFPPGFFRNLGELQSLSINWYPPASVAAVQTGDIVHIASMPHLIRFRAFGIAFKDEHAEVLGRSAFVKEIELAATLVTKRGERALHQGLETRSVSVRDVDSSQR